MSELIDVQQINNLSQSYSPKQLFGRLKTLEALEEVVFYVPFVYNFVRDKQRTAYTTDLFSHSLSQILGSHPLIVTELESKVFDAQPPILLTSDQKAAERVLYITPKEAWSALEENLKMVTAIDQLTHRFCVFRMYEEEIPCPLGCHADRVIKVWYCSLYGNKETYYFTKGTDDTGRVRMQLHYSPPIKEFVELGDKLLGLLHDKLPMEQGFEVFACETETNAHLLALKKDVKLQEKLAAKPLEESQLSTKQRADCYEMIRLYHQLYGTHG